MKQKPTAANDAKPCEQYCPGLAPTGFIAPGIVVCAHGLFLYHLGQAHAVVGDAAVEVVADETLLKERSHEMF
jgi:hypothetical protein